MYDDYYSYNSYNDTCEECGTPSTRSQFDRNCPNGRCWKCGAPIYDPRFCQKCQRYCSYAPEKERGQIQRGMNQTFPPKSAKQYVAFDLEIAKVIPGNTKDWRKYRPFGIACAATRNSDGQEKLWYSVDEKGKPRKQMIQKDLVLLVDFLCKAVQDGKTIVTWNGLGFDFDVLAEESGQWETCRTLAWNHVDMMFQILCVKGYPIGLNTVAKAMLLPGKLPGVDGSQVPKLWAEGKYNLVGQYVLQDVRTTIDIAWRAESAGLLTWISQSGNPQLMVMRDGWKKVADAYTLPQPDTSWMSNPLTRSQVAAWVWKPPKYAKQKRSAGNDKRSLLDRLLYIFRPKNK